MDDTTIMPPVIWPSSTSSAPKPRISDCMAMRTNLAVAVIMPARSLACACSCR
jgi:hypothetical protein